MREFGKKNVVKRAFKPKWFSREHWHVTCQTNEAAGKYYNIMIDEATDTSRTQSKDMEDYTIPNYAIIFLSWTTPGSSRWCVSIVIIDDNIVEDSEQLTLELVSMNPLVTVQENFSLVTVNITEETTNSFIVGMQYNHYTVNEMADHIQICLVVMDTTSRVESSVNINITSTGTARVGSEYIMPDVLTINTTNSMIGDVFCLNVTILDDHAVDSDKYFIVSLTPQVSKHFGIMPNSSTSIVTITEDTSDHVDIAFEKAEYIISDSISTLTKVCIQLTNGTLERNATVTISTGFNDIISVEGVLQEILDNPVTEPLSPVESALQSHFALVPTSSASHKTVKKRTKSLSDLRSVVSAGDTITQLSREVDSCTPEERAKLLEVISSQTGDFRVSISTKDALAMKTELNISWNKLRAMRRWLQMWKIDMSSESHMRVRANDLIGSNIHAEMVPLSFQHKDGGEVIKQAPIASIPHLWDRIVTVLEQNQSNGKLTWHNGVIPSEEIWIKLGGDKGGGTFKFCFQILNVAAPNSTDCTNVISLFEAADSLTNLRICLGQYIQQVADICTRIWSLVQVYSKQNAEQSSPFVMIT
ncbi:hypothetical protein EMCRGX_G010015 [Ephydatia muelleri]